MSVRTLSLHTPCILYMLKFTITFALRFTKAKAKGCRTFLKLGHLSIHWMIHLLSTNFKPFCSWQRQKNLRNLFRVVLFIKGKRLLVPPWIVSIGFREILFPGSHSSFWPCGGAWTLALYPLSFASSTRNQSECYIHVWSLPWTMISNFACSYLVRKCGI